MEGCLEGVNPKTRQKVVVLGWTCLLGPSTRGKSQNDLEQLDSGRRRVGERLRREAAGEHGGSKQDGGEAGGRLCPPETHGRPWPCEWVARRHCVKGRSERQYVAKTRHERRDERRDGAKRKVSEGSCLPLTTLEADTRLTGRRRRSRRRRIRHRHRRRCGRPFPHLPP